MYESEVRDCFEFMFSLVEGCFLDEVGVQNVREKK